MRLLFTKLTGMTGSFLILRWWLFIFSIGFSCSLVAQSSENPFEIKPRLGQMPASTGPAAADQPTGNPFDIIAPVVADTAFESATKPGRPSPIGPADVPAARELFVLGMILGLLLLFTILITLFRPYFGKVGRSVANDLMMSQAYREYEQGQGAPYIILYIMFMLNAGVFIFLLLRRVWKIPIDLSDSGLLLWCIAGVAFLVGLKHLLLHLVKAIFPVNKEINLYNFSIIVFNSFIGFGLLIGNLVLAIATEEWLIPTLLAIAVFIGLVYALRSFRGLLLGGRYLALYTFHFLLYICTAEIAPVMVLGKLIYNQLT